MSSSITPHPPELLKWRSQIQRRDLARTANILSHMADKIQIAEDFTTETPKKLSILIKKIASLLEENIPSAPNSDLGAIHKIITLISTHLRYVERAQVTQTPWSTIGIAEAFFSKQTGAKSHFIIRPVWSYNYSIISEFWGVYQEILSNYSWFPLDELRKKVDFDRDEKIYCISFPRIERQNVLLHALWGHEIGHILVAEWMTNNFGTQWSQAQSEITNRILSTLQNRLANQTLLDKINITRETATLTKSAMKIAEKGLTELLCDIIGVHLFGVSIIAAAIEFSALVDMDVSPLDCSYYPPWRYRIREMIKYCNDDLNEDQAIAYPSEELQPFIKWLLKAKKMTESSEDIKSIEKHTETKEAYEFIENNKAKALKEIIDVLPPESQNQYSLKEKNHLIHELVKRLEAGIPPNEVKNYSKTPSTFQDIICTGWVYKYKMIEADVNWGSPEEFSILNRLILKACESSYVHSTWGSALCSNDE